MFIVLGFRRFHKSMHFFLSFQRNVIFTAGHSFSVLRGHRVRIRLVRLTRCLDGEAEAPATPGHGEGRREGRRGGAHGRAPASGILHARGRGRPQQERALPLLHVSPGGRSHFPGPLVRHQVESELHGSADVSRPLSTPPHELSVGPEWTTPLSSLGPC